VSPEWLISQEPKWSDKQREDVGSRLRRFCAPIWNKPIRYLREADIRALLDPVWKVKRVMASRLRRNIEGVFALAIATQRHGGPNPARWKENLAHVFVAPSTLDEEPFDPVPFEQIPAFAAKLRAIPGSPARALEFLLLTAIRLDKVRTARRDQFDLKRGVWRPPHTGKHKRSLRWHQRGFHFYRALP
jgi:integrase